MGDTNRKLTDKQKSNMARHKATMHQLVSENDPQIVKLMESGHLKVAQDLTEYTWFNDYSFALRNCPQASEETIRYILIHLDTSSFNNIVSSLESFGGEVDLDAIVERTQLFLARAGKKPSADEVKNFMTTVHVSQCINQLEKKYQYPDDKIFSLYKKLLQNGRGTLNDLVSVVRVVSLIGEDNVAIQDGFQHLLALVDADFSDNMVRMMAQEVTAMKVYKTPSTKVYDYLRGEYQYPSASGLLMVEQTPYGVSNSFDEMRKAYGVHLTKVDWDNLEVNLSRLGELGQNIEQSALLLLTAMKYSHDKTFTKKQLKTYLDRSVEMTLPLSAIVYGQAVGSSPESAHCAIVMVGLLNRNLKRELPQNEMDIYARSNEAKLLGAYCYEKSKASGTSFEQEFETLLEQTIKHQKNTVFYVLSQKHNLSEEYIQFISQYYVATHGESDDELDDFISIFKDDQTLNHIFKMVLVETYKSRDSIAELMNRYARSGQKTGQKLHEFLVRKAFKSDSMFEKKLDQENILSDFCKDFYTFDSPYQVLGVDQSAKESDIKKAYRKLVLKYHPDKNLGSANAEQLFARISRANEILTDQKLRAQLDAVFIVEEPEQDLMSKASEYASSFANYFRPK